MPNVGETLGSVTSADNTVTEIAIIVKTYNPIWMPAPGEHPPCHISPHPFCLLPTGRLGKAFSL